MSTTIITEEAAFLPIAADADGGPSVSWGAIAAGAVAAAGFSLFLIELGVGVGLSAVSPWAGSGPSATTIGWSAGISLILISIMASALGGYIAGRLRRSWLAVHTDEAYLRDSAHGLVTWAFATIISAALLATAATSLTNGVVRGASANANTAYYTDMLFRSNVAVPPTAPANQANNDDMTRILTRALVPGATLPADDRTYLAQRVAARTGLSQQEAEARVDSVITQAKTAADQARKAAAALALWMAAALLAGALSASFAAAEGGRERDAR